jgi:hypothetical protein
MVRFETRSLRVSFSEHAALASSTFALDGRDLRRLRGTAVEELSRSTRIAFGIITVVNAILFFAAVAAILEERFGMMGYLLLPFAALVMSPGLLGLPWFDAWARGDAVSERIFLIWLIWTLCIVIAVALRTRRRRTRSAPLGAERNRP